MKKIGVVLSGCGVYDGAEIHESVITLLAIDRAGAQAVCMAPNVDQMHVVNHLTGEESAGEKRNVLVEAARIARGEIKDISPVKADDIDALVFPGGKALDRQLSDMTLSAVLKRMNRSDITVHGFRSTFRDWAGETTVFPREVIEAALAHQLKDKAEAAYARGDLFEKRRNLMSSWAEWPLIPVKSTS